MIKTGVYRITNTITGHFYIGSAVNIDARWARHRSDLNTKTHHNPHLTRAWHRYGSDVFRFSIELECDESQLAISEQYLIDLLRPEYNISLNVTAPMLGRKHSTLARLKISESLRRNKRPPYKRTGAILLRRRETVLRERLSRAVDGVDPNSGEIKQHFEVICDAEKHGFRKSAIIRCCKGKMKSYKGLLWRYTINEDREYTITDETRQKLSAARKGQTHTEEAREKISRAHKCTAVASYNLETKNDSQRLPVSILENNFGV